MPLVSEVDTSKPQPAVAHALPGERTELKITLQHVIYKQPDFSVRRGKQLQIVISARESQGVQGFCYSFYLRILN